jgi:hypothetical protein
MLTAGPKGKRTYLSISQTRRRSITANRLKSLFLQEAHTKAQLSSRIMRTQPASLTLHLSRRFMISRRRSCSLLIKCYPGSFHPSLLPQTSNSPRCRAAGNDLMAKSKETTGIRNVESGRRYQSSQGKRPVMQRIRPNYSSPSKVAHLRRTTAHRVIRALARQTALASRSNTTITAYPKRESSHQIAMAQGSHPLPCHRRPRAS